MSIYYRYNTDVGGNLTSVKITDEQKQVSPLNFTIQLEQVPDESYRVIVANVDGTLFTEVFNRDEVSESTFYCDYSVGKLYLHSSQQGRVKIINYYGRGMEMISAERVYDSKAMDDKGVIKTLQELIDLTKEYIAILGTFEEVQVVITKLEQNIEDGNILNTDLKNNIAIATPINTQLHSDITEAKKWKDKLSQDVIDGKALSPVLDDLIDNGQLTKTQLEQSIVNAQGDIAKIDATGNKIVKILSSEWVLNVDVYEKTITHTCNSENLHITFKNTDTKELLTVGYKTIDVNRVLIKCDEAINLTCIISASYYKVTTDLDTDITLDFVNSKGGYSTLNERIENIENKSHTHSNKNILDTITNEKISQWENNTTLLGRILRLEQNLPNYDINNIAVFNSANIRKSYKLSNGTTVIGGSLYGDAVIDEYLPIDINSKYEILVYQAEEIYIAEYDSSRRHLGTTMLSQGYRSIYDYNGSPIGAYSTAGYMSPVAFSFFTSQSNASYIKIYLHMSDYTTNPSYYPNSSSLMLDNAIKSLKIVKVGSVS